jgi:hypothetical protein
MRRIRSVLYAVVMSAAAAGTLSSPAFAGRLDDCHKPPPAWYTAPRFTHSYSEQWGAGYSRASHRYVAQRRTYAPSYARPRHYSSHVRRSHDPFGRW